MSRNPLLLAFAAVEFVACAWCRSVGQNAAALVFGFAFLSFGMVWLARR